jgi:arginase family enzyme
VGIIHLDAHYDNQPSFNGEEYARCTPFARLYETEGVGIHGPRNAPNSGRLADEAGAVTITIRDIREYGDLKGVAHKAHRIAFSGTEAVYRNCRLKAHDFNRGMKGALLGIPLVGMLRETIF